VGRSFKGGPFFLPHPRQGTFFAEYNLPHKVLILFHLKKGDTMKRMILFLMTTFLTVTLLHAQKPEVITKDKAGWNKIGDAKVDFSTDKDKFILIGKDKFKSLKIKVKDAPVNIETMQVEYEGGEKEDIALASELKTGSESRVIDLKNSTTSIKNVTFVYRTVSGSGTSKAEIELWGMK
jgi:hypothetical protein